MVRVIVVDQLLDAAGPMVAPGLRRIVRRPRVRALSIVGRIEAFPAAPGAMDKLIAAKGRDGRKPIARLAANTAQVKAESKTWSSGLKALSATYWPGPLTIVLETATGWTGYRIPDHAVALTLAGLCGRTLALTSANLSGDPDTKTAAEAAEAIEADLIIDCGPSSDQAVPSTVVKVDGCNIECLREGCLPYAEVEKVFKKGFL